MSDYLAQEIPGKSLILLKVNSVNRPIGRFIISVDPAPFRDQVFNLVNFLIY